MTSTPYLEALAIIEMLLSKTNTDKYRIAKEFLDEAKKKLEPIK